MEQTAPTAPDKKRGALWDFELTGGGFVIGLIAFLLLLLTLNYFSVLSLSTLYPKYLGFLPHKKPTGISDSSKTIQLASSRERADVQNLTEKVVAPSMRTSITNMNFAKQTIDNDFGYTYYGADTSLQTGEFLVSLVGYDTKGQITDRQITINHVKASSNINASNSASIIANYLQIEPKSPFTCILPKDKPGAKSICESIWRDTGSVKGVSVIQISEDEIFLNYCDHPENSQLFNWKSCIYDYRETGLNLTQ